MLLSQICFLFFFVVTALATYRSYRLFGWIKLKGTVLGADGAGDSSAVRIQFMDPTGRRREFTSGVQFGHTYRAKKRIPYEAGQTVVILVNPYNFEQAELYLKWIFWLPVVMGIISLWCAFQLRG